MKECTQCGKCCLLYSDGGLSASAEDLAGWETFNPGIAAYVANGKIWVNPETGESLKRCPWLQQLPAESVDAPVRYGCQIYHDRPEDCRHYPSSVGEMVRDGCEMIEVRDLAAPEQARETLDRLMSGSRPIAPRHGR